MEALRDARVVAQTRAAIAFADRRERREGGEETEQDVHFRHLVELAREMLREHVAGRKVPVG